MLSEYLPPTIGGVEILAAAVARSHRESNHQVTICSVSQARNADYRILQSHDEEGCDVLKMSCDLSHPFVDLRFLSWAARRPYRCIRMFSSVITSCLRSERLKFRLSDVPWFVSFLKACCLWYALLEEAVKLGPPNLVHSYSAPGIMAARSNPRTTRIKRIFVYTGFPLSRWDNLLAVTSSHGAILPEDGTVHGQIETLQSLGVPLWRTYAMVDGNEILTSQGLNFDSLREKLRIPEGSAILTVIGRADPSKGIDEALRAFPLIAKSRDDAHLVLSAPTPPHAFVWNTEYPNEIQKVIASMEPKIRENVTWIREGLAHPQALLLMSNSDVVIFSSPICNGGIALKEAMLVGAPIVASNSTGTDLFIEHEVTGLLYETGRPEDLATAVLRMLNNPPLRANLSEAAKKRSRERKFLLQDSVGDLEAFYAAVLSGAPSNPWHT